MEPVCHGVLHGSGFIPPMARQTSFMLAMGFSTGMGVATSPPDLKMRKIQPTRVLVRDGFGHNWTAVSANPDETGVKRMLSTRSSVLRCPKLSKINIF